MRLLLFIIVAILGGIIVGRFIYIMIDEAIKSYRFKKEIKMELDRLEKEDNSIDNKND